jgi:hypothetical protein
LPGNIAQVSKARASGTTALLDLNLGTPVLLEDKLPRLPIRHQQGLEINRSGETLMARPMLARRKRAGKYLRGAN